MIKDIRCDEIKNNPSLVIPEYFCNGWLGGATLKNAFNNLKIYKKSRGKTRQMLDEGILSDNDYVLAAEQAFLYGKVSSSVLKKCTKAYIAKKIKRTSALNCSGKLIEIQDIHNEYIGQNVFDVDQDYIEKKFHIEKKADIIHSSDYDSIVSDLERYDKEHVWMFDAGHNGRRDFRGNPKYLFAYVNKYRPDIYAYWYCEQDAEETIEQVRKLGWCGVCQGTKEANYLLSKTGVVVSEQLRETMPFSLFGTKYVNLWHGVGFKRIERSHLLDVDDLRMGIAKKYISFNSFYKNNQLLVVTSPIYEKEFCEDFGISDNHMLKTGYLRCQYQNKYDPVITYDHDIRKIKNLSQNSRLAVYAPTFRAKRGTAFVDGIKDLEALYRKCESEDILLIFKVHPHIEKEVGFLKAKECYGDKPYFLFWDNSLDFYEIMNQIDLVIYDYSSIFSDFLCAGVKHFVRYIYDEDEYMQEGFTQGREAYYERTCGITCHTFEEMLDAIENYTSVDDSEETYAIYKRIWEYAGDNDFEKTIQGVFDFTPETHNYPTLYSFDIFDTLISRKGLLPYSIFYKVSERMKEYGGYDEDFIKRYAIIRHGAEMNVREFYKKTTQTRHSEKTEIQMYEIFERIKDVYDISEAQSLQLMDWEVEEEIASAIPISSGINKILKLVEAGESVVLISDMYLPKQVISDMLVKVCPELGRLPLFVSSEYGFQKTTKLLFFEVYRSFKPYYCFDKWIHYGDTLASDKLPARSMGIHTITVDKPILTTFESTLIEQVNSYDAYLYAALCARMHNRIRSEYLKTEFVIDIIASTLISYVDLVLRKAIKNGFEILYFIARDGHFLKLIADKLIEVNNWPIETRYLYASRRTWRVQSYFDDIDETFWISQGGNFNDINSKESMLNALFIDEETLAEICPYINLDEIEWDKGQPGHIVASLIQHSTAYHNYLLEKAKDLRILPCKYLKQELNPDKKIAFVEYWGRGYNQECMNRLWSYVTGKKETTHYFYARSILPSDKYNKRYDMTDLDVNIALFEAIFANMPYKSVENYFEQNGRIEPVIESNYLYDKSLYNTMGIILPLVAEEYAKADFVCPEIFSRNLFDFALSYINDNKSSELISEGFGSLCDSMSIYGEVKEYAPAYTNEDLNDFDKGKARGDDTLSIQMSYGRATDSVKAKYNEMYQVSPGEDPFKSPKLSKTEISTNSSYKKKYEAALTRSERAKRLYYSACNQRNVFNKVTIVSNSKDFKEDVFYSLKELLNYNQKYIVEWLTADVDADKDPELMRQLALARIIIVYGNITQLLQLKFRPETTSIFLLDRGFRLYRFGRYENVKLFNQYRYDTFVNSCRPNIIENTSYYNKELFGYTMDINDAGKLNGACVTDVLFDKNYKNQSLEIIHSLIPETSGKRIIVYMPTPRYRKNCGNWLELLDLDLLSKSLAGEYYVLLDFRSNISLAEKCKNVKNIPGFCKDVSKEKITLRNMLSVADVVIGDYRDTFFESALLGVPVYSTAVDLEDVQSSSNNLAYNLSDIYPFPIVHNSEELIECFKDNKEYDYTILDEFRQKYLVGCDGMQANRIREYIDDIMLSDRM